MEPRAYVAQDPEEETGVSESRLVGGGRRLTRVHTPTPRGRPEATEGVDGPGRPLTLGIHRSLRLPRGAPP